MIIPFAYSLVRKLVISIGSRLNWVKKMKKIYFAKCFSLIANIFIFNANLWAYQQANTYYLNIELSKK